MVQVLYEITSSYIRDKSSSMTSNANTNTINLHSHSTTSYKPTLHPNQITQFENNIQQQLESMLVQSSLSSSSSTTSSSNPLNFQNHNYYKLWTTTLHRDMYVGLGLQLCERNGYIHVNALICPNGRKITSIGLRQM